MVALEAAGCGRATVGTRVGILPDLYGDRWTVPAGDPAALATTLLAVLSDPEALADLARTSHRAVQECYLLERTVTELQQIYTRVAS